MAGQPIFMQLRQPLHLSLSMASGGFAFTYLSSWQGRRTMTTLGASAASSSLMAASVAAMSWGSTTRTRSMPAARHTSSILIG